MKVSVCVTLLNEEKSIGALLESLLSQSHKPDEIVIVDGGSGDRTVEIVNHYQKKDRRIKLVIEPGSIAHGRNVSIDLSKNDIVALTDAGCIAKKDWLEKITKPFLKSGVDMVAGFYEMSAGSSLQRVMNLYLGTPPERFDRLSFLPSTRSIAFKKSLWEEVGGFNEKLFGAGEDTEFCYKVVRAEKDIARVGQARVIWKELENYTFSIFLRKLRNYSKGDVKTGILWHPTKAIMSHNIKVMGIFIRYFAGFVLLSLSVVGRLSPIIPGLAVLLYLFWSVAKWRDGVKKWEERFYLPIVQVGADFAVMTGFISGLLKFRLK